MISFERAQIEVLESDLEIIIADDDLEEVSSSADLEARITGIYTSLTDEDRAAQQVFIKLRRAFQQIFDIAAARFTLNSRPGDIVEAPTLSQNWARIAEVSGLILPDFKYGGVVFASKANCASLPLRTLIALMVPLNEAKLAGQPHTESEIKSRVRKIIADSAAGG